MLLPYRVKISDTKVTHFTPILALCTCLYRSHLGQQNTAESQRLKIYVQNVHHSREHMHSNGYATAQSLPRWRCAWSSSLHSLSRRSFNFQRSFNLHHGSTSGIDSLLKHTPDAVVHRIQIWRIRWPHLWRDKLWRLSLQHGDSARITCTMCWCTILLKKRSNSRKQSGYPA